MGGKKDKRVREFVKRVKKDFRIDKVIFFGSRVRDENLKHSDYDLIVVSKDFENMFFTDRTKKCINIGSITYP